MNVGCSPYIRTIYGSTICRTSSPAFTLMWTMCSPPSKSTAFNANHVILLAERGDTIEADSISDSCASADEIDWPLFLHIAVDKSFAFDIDSHDDVVLHQATDDDDISSPAVATCHSDGDAVAIDDVTSDVSDYETNELDHGDGIASLLSSDEQDEHPLSGIPVPDCSDDSSDDFVDPKHHSKPFSIIQHY